MSGARTREALEALSWIGCALTLAAAMWLRLVDIDHLPGINGDEAFYGVHALDWLAGSPLSSLRTGRNLPMNALFFGPVVLFHRLFAPSVLTLRAAALALSLLSIGLALLLFRRRGWTFVGPFAAAIAVLPIHMGYARFAWDASAVPSAMVMALAAATARRAGLTALAFAICLWVHPVTIFALPVLVAPFLAASWPRDADGRMRAPKLRTLAWSGLAASLAAALAFALVRYKLLPAVVLAWLRGELPRIAARLASPADALYYLRLYADLLAGPTLYRYITGSLPEAAETWHLLLGLTLVAALSFGAVPRLRAARRWNDLAVIVGLGVSLFLSYAIGGLRVLSPGTERYGMFLTVPSCYVLATCAEVLSSDRRRALWLRTTLAAFGVLLLISFHQHYLQALRRADPQRHDTFRSGDVEPKRAAWDALLRMREPSRPAIVMAEDWWIYWAVRYFGHGQPNVRITIPGTEPDARFPADFAPLPRTPGDAQLFGIAWADGAFDRQLSPLAERQAAVYGYEPGPILRVHLLRSPLTR
jgi:hypothetical protein